jgi:hypothetical protein
MKCGEKGKLSLQIVASILPDGTVHKSTGLVFVQLYLLSDSTVCNITGLVLCAVVPPVCLTAQCATVQG